jgi:hypothetical protein
MASLAEAAGRAAYGDGKHLQADPPGPLQPKPSAPKAAYRTRVHDIQNWLLCAGPSPKAGMSVSRAESAFGADSRRDDRQIRSLFVTAIASTS